MPKSGGDAIKLINPAHTETTAQSGFERLVIKSAYLTQVLGDRPSILYAIVDGGCSALHVAVTSDFNLQLHLLAIGSWKLGIGS
ncbi:hypothetical protein FACHB389_35960 [Nostoc calcicola FACHB-389]|nr:hypothetical protein [Nostoc calcicola FACHB-3891]OKH14572.1 hypothetical protein FACHB389_35960 [Nostoc calcicola FACHB-389]